MIPLRLQELTIQMILMMKSIKTRNMRKLNNKTLLLKQMIKFQEPKRNRFKPEQKKAQNDI